ncbi:L-fucose dehydrogenase [Salegentibacter salinarum]|uniref:L-fucose dehydrogenase n=1 Tax=Salegentibacter salinarum TaxID=447422 RepID=A0A2N0TN70_9FLAO|nr:aldo/keto reductase [Salegentibacter salinarum]PKD16166.1 L-fucose dehydrogenase [Salegentibacter salinarum]SKB68521.1 D-threo-aldose 1-dehydrogenase [Salegentibacter salinarum]
MSQFKLQRKFGLGGVAIGNGFKPLSDAEAEKTLEGAWEAGVRYYDTSPWYGLGLSERRFGHFLHNKKREDYVLSTKVGRVLKATKNVPETMWNNPAPFDYKYDYSAEAVRRSIEDSLQRLGVESIDYAFIHDLSPDHNDDYEEGTTWEDHFEVARTGAIPELQRMKEEGLIKAWGMGVNTLDPILKLLEVSKPDVFLSAIQYSLVHHKDALERLLPAIEKSEATLINAAPFNAGLLAGQKRYNYAGEMPDDISERYKNILKIAEKHKVNLVAASLQFSLAPKVAGTVLAGASKPEQVQENIKALEEKIPAEFWSDLKKEKLIEEKAEVPA